MSTVFRCKAGNSLAAKETTCSCAQSARPEHDSGSGLQPLQLVEKGRHCRPFSPGHVSPAPEARPGKRAGKPCCARLPNPPRMSPGSDCIWRASALQTSPKGASTVRRCGRHRKGLVAPSCIPAEVCSICRYAAPCCARLPNPPDTASAGRNKKSEIPKKTIDSRPFMRYTITRSVRWKSLGNGVTAAPTTLTRIV